MPMKTVFANARLIDPESQTDSPGWVCVEAGKIVATGSKDAPKAQEAVDCGGLCLAPGIVDIGVKVSEPGERHKESYASAGAAAAAGGVTTIITRPDTSPAKKVSGVGAGWGPPREPTTTQGSTGTRAQRGLSGASACSLEIPANKIIQIVSSSQFAPCGLWPPVSR